MSILRTIARQCISSFLVIAFSICTSYAQTNATPEYQLKAVFLFNFTQFVEWPATSFATGQSPFIIGIIGEDPFSTYLNDIISGEKVNGHPIVIQHYSHYEDTKNCHILFIADNGTNTIGQITTSLKKNSVLTVGDAPTFLMQGGMVRLITKNNKIQIQINLDATREANLVISSKLLRLADIYVSNKN